MELFLAWAHEHWFTLVQSIGIIGSILLTGAALRRDRKTRRISDLLAISEQHHELWGDMLSKPELSRVTAPEVDLIERPISVPEEEFLNLVISHFFLWWLLAKESQIVSVAVLESDAQSFFNLPIPKVVWGRTKGTRDPAFVRFIEKALS